MISRVMKMHKQKGKYLVFAFVAALLAILFIRCDNDEVVPVFPDTNVQNNELDGDLNNDASIKLSVSVLHKNGNVEMMDLEDYIVSVVLREMPADFETEALKAQAVVARTYTFRRIKFAKKHKNADVCADSSCCQGFWDPDDYLNSGGIMSSLNKVKDAVSATYGQILVYEDKPIEATYFSCSGGITEDAVAVWGANVPYLQSTDSPGEEASKHYSNTVIMQLEIFLTKLGISQKSNESFSVNQITYTSGGGVESICICGKVFTGTEVRKKLQLKSTSFSISRTGNTVSIMTKGYGHRVGMSQYGADAMAATGRDYKEILLHYYSGVELSDIRAFY